MQSKGPGRYIERKTKWLQVAGSKGKSPRLPQVGLQLLGRGREQERDFHMVAASQRSGRLQEPEKHMGAHVDGTAGQREVAAVESDSRIGIKFTSK